MKQQPVSALCTAKSAYGDGIPSWVRSMAEECDRSSQKSFASRIKRSPALVNQVLKNRYGGDIEDVRRRVEATLMPCVHCPVLGEISGPECIVYQGKRYDPSNNLAVRMFIACRKCPNRLGKKGENDAPSQ